MKKRILSIFLCLVMVFSLLPFTASAAGATPIDEKNFPDPVFREYVRKVAGSSVLTDTIGRSKHSTSARITSKRCSATATPSRVSRASGT